jgi:threonine dehydratase
MTHSARSRPVISLERQSETEKTFFEILRHADATVTVSEEGIVKDWKVMKIIVESSGAVAYTAIVEGKVELADKRIGLILSDGNLGLDRLLWQK